MVINRRDYLFYLKFLCFSNSFYEFIDYTLKYWSCKIFELLLH